MRHLSIQAFLDGAQKAVQEHVDFILFSGDMFNTSLPSLDTLKIVTKKLKELKDKNIPIYAIAGSHDFSPSGKTMLDVLENAGLLSNVCKGRVDPETRKLSLNFTIDTRTGAKITGIVGRKGMLDRVYYENLDLEALEKEPGYKIFLFHTALTELKPKHLEHMETHPLSFLPKHFNYYAGGHVHHRDIITVEDYGIITYPGAMFPNNFAELEKYSTGGFNLITITENQTRTTWIPLKVIEHQAFTVNCYHKTPEIIVFETLNHFHNQDLTNTIITLRFEGTLEKGKVSEINFKEMLQKLQEQGAYFIMKNTAKLQSQEFEAITINHSDPEKIEEEVIKEHLQQLSTFSKEREQKLIQDLLHILNTTKREGETNTDFQKRIVTDMNKTLAINDLPTSQ